MCGGRARPQAGVQACARGRARRAAAGRACRPLRAGCRLTRAPAHLHSRSLKVSRRRNMLSYIFGPTLYPWGRLSLRPACVCARHAPTAARRRPAAPPPGAPAAPGGRSALRWIAKASLCHGYAATARQGWRANRCHGAAGSQRRAASGTGSVDGCSARNRAYESPARNADCNLNARFSFGTQCTTCGFKAHVHEKAIWPCRRLKSCTKV